MTVTIPDGAIGWAHVPGASAVGKDYGPNGDLSGPVIVVWRMTGTYVDPCTDHTLKQPAPQGVEELIADLGNQPGISAGPATDVTISGYAGQYVETTITADIRTCGNGEDGFWLWASGGDRRYVQDTGEINRMYALDVDGRIFTFDVILPPTTTDADRAELDAMVESIVIDAPAPRPSAVGSIPGNLLLTDGDWAMTVDVPAGWTKDGDNGITKNYGPNGELPGAALRLERIAGTVVNPCFDHTRVLPDPTTPEGLVAALASQAGTDPTPSIADIAVDGYAGKGFELVVTTDILTCIEDELWLWATANRGPRAAEDSAEVNQVQVLDVNGELFTYVARIPARTTEADRRELEGILTRSTSSRRRRRPRPRHDRVAGPTSAHPTAHLAGRRACHAMSIKPCIGSCSARGGNARVQASEIRTSSAPSWWSARHSRDARPPPWRHLLRPLPRARRPPRRPRARAPAHRRRPRPRHRPRSVRAGCPPAPRRSSTTRVWPR